MAEPTEQEQIKQTQTLDKIQAGQQEVVGRLDTVISSLKETSAHEEAMVQVAEQGQDAEKTLAKIDNKKLSLSERTQKLQEKNTGILENFVDAFEDSTDNTKDYQKLMERIEKQKLGIQKAADAKDKREDKLGTRMAKGAWGGIKTAGSKLVKSVGSFTSALAKLAGLVLLWALLKYASWEGAKKMWDKFVKEMEKIRDKWIPEWIQNLSWWEVVAGSVAGLATAYIAFKKGVAAAKWGIRKLGINLGAKLGIKSALRVQLDDTVKALDNLTNQRNAIKRLHDLETNVGKKSKLAKQIDKLDTRIEKLTTDKNAMKKALAIDDMLNQNSSLATQIDEADLKLKSLAKEEHSVLKKIKKLGKGLDKDSKLATMLDEIQKSIASIESEKGALQKMLNLNKDELARTQKAKKVEGLMKAAKAGGKSGISAQKQLRTMGIDPETGLAFADDVPTKSRALMSAEEIIEDNRKIKSTKTDTKMVGRTKTKMPTGPEVMKVMTQPKSGMLSGILKNAGQILKGGGAMALRAMGWIFKYVGAPLEAVRGFKAGWLSVPEDAPWDVQMRAGWLGMWRNVGDLVFTDTLRGFEALGGLGGDLVKGIFSGGDFNWGATKLNLGSKWTDEFLTKNMVGIKKGTRIEDRLMKGEFDNPDGSLNFSKFFASFGTDDKLRMDSGTGNLKKAIDYRKKIEKQEKEGNIGMVDQAALTTVRALGTGGNVVVDLLTQLNDATERMNAELLKQGMQINPGYGVGVIKKDTSVVSKNGTADQAGVWLQYNGYGN